MRFHAPARRKLMLPLAVGFVAFLLVVLAVLQYRWTGELSEAERNRMRSGARVRAEQLAQDFDREVTRAFIWLQMDAETLKKRDWAHYGERYARWSGLTSDPGFVKEVFLAERGEDGRETFLRFDPVARTFGTAEWPEVLRPVRERVGELTRPGERERTGHFFPRGRSDLVTDEIPALLIPVVSLEGRAGTPRPHGFTIVVLDRELIASRMLPRLAHRYFAAGGESDYNVVVTRLADPKVVVYRSADSADVAAPGDAAVGLLDFRFDEATPDDLQALVPRREGSGGPRPDEHRFGAHRPGQPRERPDSGAWRLTVTHRLGSVDAVVAAAHRRNLLASFGILGLLGASAALIALAAARSRQVAERQMEFVAGVSHELRTPVSVICSAGENMADGLVSGAESVRRYGTLVRDEGRRLAALVEQVLDFAGTYSGRHAYRKDPLAVNALVDAALEASRPALAEADLQVEREVAAGLPALAGDGPALTRALRNLIENAVKYRGESRFVRVAASGYVSEGRPRVRLVVEDRGLGIAPPELRHIFEPFYRGHDAAERQIRGSGLGLALVRSIVRAHGGEVTVKSEPGQGSSFTVDLPAEAVASPVLGAGEVKESDGIAHPAG
jgi:signal transduction histidine kinase